MGFFHQQEIKGRKEGIEPSTGDPQSPVLPLHYIRQDVRTENAGLFKRLVIKSVVSNAVCANHPHQKQSFFAY